MPQTTEPYKGSGFRVWVGIYIYIYIVMVGQHVVASLCVLSPRKEIAIFILSQHGLWISIGKDIHGVYVGFQ